MLPDALAIVPSDRPSWNVQGHQRSAPLWALMPAGPGGVARRDMKLAPKNPSLTWTPNGVQNGIWLFGHPKKIDLKHRSSGGIWMSREPWKSDDWFTNAYDKSGVMCRICFELVNNKFLDIRRSPFGKTLMVASAGSNGGTQVRPKWHRTRLQGATVTKSICLPASILTGEFQKV